METSHQLFERTLFCGMALDLGNLNRYLRHSFVDRLDELVEPSGQLPSFIRAEARQTACQLALPLSSAPLT